MRITRGPSQPYHVPQPDERCSRQCEHESSLLKTEVNNLKAINFENEQKSRRIDHRFALLSHQLAALIPGLVSFFLHRLGLLRIANEIVGLTFP